RLRPLRRTGRSCQDKQVSSTLTLSDATARFPSPHDSRARSGPSLPGINRRGSLLASFTPIPGKLRFRSLRDLPPDPRRGSPPPIDEVPVRGAKPVRTGSRALDVRPNSRGPILGTTAVRKGNPTRAWATYLGASTGFASCGSQILTAQVFARPIP